VEILLKKVPSYYVSLGIKVERLMSDNGPAYRSRPIALMLQKIGIRHNFTKPYTLKTNGEAVRFIQKSLWEWAYAIVYQNSDHSYTSSIPSSTDITSIALTAL
jgi:transposase InsO family protein